MPVIDNAIYRDGARVATPSSLEETFVTREAHGGFAWIGLYRPTDAELDAVASEFGLHPLADEDARKGHQRATRPLVDMFTALERGFEKYHIDLELQRYLRDVKDHVIRIIERGESFRQLLQNALQVHATLVGQRQNEEMKRLSETSLAQSEQTKKISSWAAILFAPTLVGTIYGMNFVYMPELDWVWGYPFAVSLMIAMGLGLYLVFKNRNWL